MGREALNVADPMCKGCIYKQTIGGWHMCGYFDVKDTTRVAKYGLPLPRPCLEKETKKRGRPKRNKTKE